MITMEENFEFPGSANFKLLSCV